MDNDPTMRRHPRPISTPKSPKTAIYNPPEDGFPFVAAVFSSKRTVLTFRAFRSRHDAETFVQVFAHESAVERDLTRITEDTPTTVPR